MERDRPGRHGRRRRRLFHPGVSKPSKPPKQPGYYLSLSVAGDGDIEFRPLTASWRHTDHPVPTEHPNRAPFALADIAAYLLAQSVHEIRPEWLDLPRLCLRRVWNQIISTGKDLFNAFCMMATAFDEPFVAHDTSLPRSYVLCPRNDALSQCKLPRCCHRLENVPLLVPVAELCKPLGFNPLVVLDLSRTPEAGDDRFNVFNVPNLVALNLSGTLIDDAFLYSMVKAIGRGKLANLLVLMVNNCPLVTENGILPLFHIEKGALCYIESSHQLHTPLTRRFEGGAGIYYDYVEAGRHPWFKLDNSLSDIRMIYRLPLTLKVMLLWRRFSPNLDPKRLPEIAQLRENIVLDYMYCDSVEDGWRYRLSQRNGPRGEVYGYMMNHFAGRDKKPTPRAPTRAGTILRKKIMTKVSPQEFFGT